MNMIVSPLMAQEAEEKKKSKIVRPVFSIFTSMSFLVDSGELGTAYAPLSISGIEFYLGIPKIYLYLSGAFAYSLVVNDIYNYGGGFNTKFGFGVHVYSKLFPYYRKRMDIGC